MTPCQNFDVDAVLALSSSIADQARKYSSMIQPCAEAVGDVSSLPTQSLKEVVDSLTQECRKLQAIVTEPAQWMVAAAWSYCDSAALSLIIEMGIPKLIDPQGPGVTLNYLAESTNASPALIKRAMAPLISRFIFTQSNDAKYHHNRHSLELLNSNFSSLVHYLVDDGFLCGAHLAKTASSHGFRTLGNPNKAAFGVAFQTDLTLYEYYHSVDAKRGQRFARAMAGHYDGPLDMPIERIYPFDKLPNGAVIIDVGGGKGQNAIRLVSQHPQLSVIVQDHASVVSVARGEARERLDPEILTRISWEGHNYYSPQPRMRAAVYLLSHVFMDNSDENCIRMLQAIAGAMDEAESTLLIHDFVDLPKAYPDRPHLLDMLDLHMIASLDTHSRSEAEFDVLIAAVARPKLVRHKTWPGRDGSAVLEVRVQTTPE